MDFMTSLQEMHPEMYRWLTMVTPAVLTLMTAVMLVGAIKVAPLAWTVGTMLAEQTACDVRRILAPYAEMATRISARLSRLVAAVIQAFMLPVAVLKLLVLTTVAWLGRLILSGWRIFTSSQPVRLLRLALHVIDGTTRGAMQWLTGLLSQVVASLAIGFRDAQARLFKAWTFVERVVLMLATLLRAMGATTVAHARRVLQRLSQAVAGLALLIAWAVRPMLAVFYAVLRLIDNAIPHVGQVIRQVAKATLSSTAYLAYAGWAAVWTSPIAAWIVSATRTVFQGAVALAKHSTVGLAGIFRLGLSLATRLFSLAAIFATAVALGWHIWAMAKRHVLGVVTKFWSAIRASSFVGYGRGFGRLLMRILKSGANAFKKGALSFVAAVMRQTVQVVNRLSKPLRRAAAGVYAQASLVLRAIALLPLLLMFLPAFIIFGGFRSPGALPRSFEVFRQALSTRTRLGLYGLCGVLLASLTMCTYTQLNPPVTFRLIAGSGFSTYEPMLKRYAQQNNLNLQIDYKGSIDIMRMLEDGSINYDAIWEADSLWTSMGDKQRLVRDSKSIACSPVVFGIKKSLAQALGWVGRRDVRVQDILKALQSRSVRTMMTSATQSNSGASAYFGFLYAFAGNPDVLTSETLHDPAVREQVKSILGMLNRTSESSGWLRDLFLAEYDHYDAMFNYESHVILADQELAKTGRDPLYIIYPLEGLGTADFPLSFVKKDNADKEAVFLKFQQYLLSDAGQQEIASKGRRVGALCDKMDPAANRADWGVDLGRTLNTFRFPVEPVIREALNLYQTAFRKPSFTVYCLDFSGSMAGKGEQQLKQAMRVLLNQQEASQYLLQASPDDVTVVLIFDASVRNATQAPGWTVAGNDAQRLNALLGQIESEHPDGGTDIYEPVARALEIMQGYPRLADKFPAIILMTDGQSNHGSLVNLKAAINHVGFSVPVYAITFGDASPDQLKQIADLTSGRVFDGTKDLVGAFRSAKGNN